MDDAKRHQETFLQTVKRVCVVGHGPSIRGQGFGSFIDGHDCVIRMVECDWQQPKDYGVKYDIGIFSNRKTAKIAPHVTSIPTEEWWQYITGKGETIRQRFRGRPVRMVQDQVFQYLENGRPHFSRGTAATLASIELFENLQEITLVGFDAVQYGQFEKGNHHPPELRSFLDDLHANKGKQNTHDWAYEREVLQEISETIVPIRFFRRTISASYQELCQQYHRERQNEDDPWGESSGKWMEIVAMLMHASRAHTVLDYGSGQGVLSEKLRSRGYDVTEYDPGIPEKQAHPSGQFDFVVCTDVFEHVEEQYIDDVLMDIYQYMRQGGFFTICLKRARRYHLPDGRNAHILLKPRAWWVQKLERLWDVHILEGRGWHSRELVVYVKP